MHKKYSISWAECGLNEETATRTLMKLRQYSKKQREAIDKEAMR